MLPFSEHKISIFPFVSSELRYTLSAIVDRKYSLFSITLNDFPPPNLQSLPTVQASQVSLSYKRLIFLLLSIK